MGGRKGGSIGGIGAAGANGMNGAMDGVMNSFIN